MRLSSKQAGFNLIELLVVLAIIGTISAIAIPAYLGQRRKARLIGDAQTNAKVLAMALETRKADFGVYGASGKTQTWTGSTTDAGGASTNLAPSFTPQGNSKMTFLLKVTSGGLAYTITAKDPQMGGASILVVDHTGTILYKK